MYIMNEQGEIKLKWIVSLLSVKQTNFPQIKLSHLHDQTWAEINLSALELPILLLNIQSGLSCRRNQIGDCKGLADI